jgi:hypothetical protein
VQMVQASSSGGETRKRYATNWRCKTEEQGAGIAVESGCEVGRRDAVQRYREVVGRDSTIHDIESEHMSVQCFHGIRSEQVQKKPWKTEL